MLTDQCVWGSHWTHTMVWRPFWLDRSPRHISLCVDSLQGRSFCKQVCGGVIFFPHTHCTREVVMEAWLCSGGTGSPYTIFQTTPPRWQCRDGWRYRRQFSYPASSGTPLMVGFFLQVDQHLHGVSGIPYLDLLPTILQNHFVVPGPELH